MADKKVGGIVIDKELAAKVTAIELLMLDVDGVMTDGGIYYDDNGDELKRFDVRDGHGIKLLMRGGIDVAIVTGRNSRVVEHRAKNLGITLVYQGALDKSSAFAEILERKGLTAEKAAFMGDDIIDLPALTRAGLSITVPDAAPEVIVRADYVTKKTGGRGAVREAVELILKAQGKWDAIVAKYLG